MSAARKARPRPAAEPPEEVQLPSAARHCLSELFTELDGVAILLAQDGLDTAIGEHDEAQLKAALGKWVLRIRNDLGKLECGRFPAGAGS